MSSPIKTLLWRTAIVAALIILIAGGFYAEENARGLNAWKKVQHDLAARGESLNWNDFIPPPVPDSQNFYKAPMMTEWFIKATNGGSAYNLNKLMANPDTTASAIDEISASNYLAWCMAFEPEFNQIRDALKRPLARLDGNYSTPWLEPIPNFVNYRAINLVLAHRAKCHLLLGESSKALDDLTLLDGLNMTLASDGKPTTLVASMIHTAIAAVYCDAIAYGLDAHLWRTPELSILQKQLGEIHLLPAVANSLRSDRAGSCHALDSTSVDEFIRVMGAPKSMSDLGWLLMPRGWIYQNEAVIASVEDGTIACINLTNQTISPFKAKAANQYVERALNHVTPWNFIAAISVPSFTKAEQTMARNQTWVDHAQIVCALERFHLASGKYPASLGELVPQYLEKIPHDIITGKPMPYQSKDGQNFTLYSIGWNEIDDGGITVRNSSGNEDRESGDWVWHYPTQ